MSDPVRVHNPATTRVIADALLSNTSRPDGMVRASYDLAALEEAATITTVDQLDALPVKSLVRDDEGDVHEKTRDGAWWEMTSGSLGGHYPAAALVGPLAGNVTLLWTPDGDR